MYPTDNLNSPSFIPFIAKVVNKNTETKRTNNDLFISKTSKVTGKKKIGKTKKKALIKYIDKLWTFGRFFILI